jgi:hypothetical protein
MDKWRRAVACNHQNGERKSNVDDDDDGSPNSFVPQQSPENAASAPPWLATIDHPAAGTEGTFLLSVSVFASLLLCFFLGSQKIAKPAPRVQNSHKQHAFFFYSGYAFLKTSSRHSDPWEIIKTGL